MRILLVHQNTGPGFMPSGAETKVKLAPVAHAMICVWAEKQNNGCSF